MSFVPRPQEIYKHFKGNLYQIVAIATHSETGEKLVIYQALYGDFQTYARPLDDFTGRVDKTKYPDVTQEFRFELQGAGNERQKAESGSDRTAEDTFAGDTVKDGVSQDTGTHPPDGDTQIDPLVMEFLDADSYEQRLNILAALHHRITDSMINTMAVVCDVEVDDGDIEDRYDSLKRCLLTREKYETNRLR